MKTVNPYLNFDGNAREAFDYYRSVFGGDFITELRYRDFGDNGMNVPEADLDKLAHIALPIGNDSMVMGCDALASLGQSVKFGNNFYISIEVESDSQADKLFTELSADGRVEMPLDRTEWAEKFGMCADRFGVQWMISYTGSVVFQQG